MLQLLKIYKDVIQINVSRRRKNKYDFYAIKFTGVNNYGNTIVFAMAFTNIKCKESYHWILKNFLKKAKSEFIDFPKMMILPLEQDCIDAQKELYPNEERNIKIIVN